MLSVLICISITAQEKKPITIGQYANDVLHDVSGYSVEELILTYGVPNSVKIKIINNKYSEIKDIEYTLSFNFGHIVLTYIGHNKSYLVGELGIIKSGYFTKHKIDIGTKIAELRELIKGDYQKSPAISFQFEDDAIKEIVLYNLE
jgi:hypothetical protein